MKSKMLGAIALALIPTFAVVELASAAGAAGGAGTGAAGTGGTAATGTGTAGAATGATGTATGATGTAAGTATGNGSGKSAEITSSMLPEVPSVTYSGALTVGAELPGIITYYPVPNYDEYSYAVVNNERVLVDPNTHRILRLIP